MKPISTLVIDDEPLAREGIREYVDRVDFLSCIGEASDGLAALRMVQEIQPQLLLLDVQMPGLSGIDLIRSLSNPPKVVLTTAHPAFAVEGFELEVVDYLLKPIRFPRFLQAMLRVQQHLTEPTLVPTNPISKETQKEEDHFFVKCESRIEKIFFAEVRFLEAMQNYVKIHTEREVFTALLTLKHCLAQLPSQDFIQIHKSFVVNAQHIGAIEGNQIIIAEQYLPISRSRRAEVEAKVLGDRLL
ncbi:MAG: LytTR family DNA-binding domain-containing protein [Bacteroidota bacterium]